MENSTIHNGSCPHKYICVLCAIIALVLLVCTSCTHKEQEDIEGCVLGFAQDYFNLRYSHAAKSCTPQSEKWIRQKATNIHQDDLDVLNNQTDTASCTIEDIQTKGDSAIVMLSASNFLVCDSVGKVGTIWPMATFRIMVVEEAGKWSVALDGPLEPINPASK